MRIGRTATVAAVIAILCMALAHTAMAEDLIVVATKATYQASQKWVDFLISNEVPVKHVTPQEFAKYKKEKYVVLMGGMDEPNGIKDIAKEVLTEEEFQWVTQEGNGDMYFKFKVWDPMQSIIVFAGANRTAAETARKDNKDVWWDLIVNWFDLDIDTGILTY